MLQILYVYIEIDYCENVCISADIHTPQKKNLVFPKFQFVVLNISYIYQNLIGYRKIYLKSFFNYFFRFSKIALKY
jgi:hypothetical protein